MVKKSKRKLHSRFNKKATLVVLIILIALAGVAYAAHRPKDTAYKPSPAVSTNPDKPKVNYNPPTDQEKKDTQAYKQGLENSPPPSPPTSNGKIQVTPVITSGNGNSNYEARAYVTGVFEEGGICMATATKTGSSPVTGTSTGFSNSNYTSCAPIHLSFPSAGSWALTMSYSSAKAEGKSAPAGITIN
jgi:cytoskeletal protein RodZ